MKLFDENGNRVAVRKAARWPKIGSGKNTIWYEADIEIDGEKVTVYWECARGGRYYFRYKEEHYYMPFEVKCKEPPFLKSNVEIDWERQRRFTIACKRQT